LDEYEESNLAFKNIKGDHSMEIVICARWELSFVILIDFVLT